MRKWPQGIRKIYHDHVRLDRICKDGDSLGMQELSRQVEVMQRKSSSLAAKGKQTETTCKMDISKKMHDNTELIQELDELRMEKKSLERHAKDLEFSVALMEKKVAARRADPAPTALSGQPPLIAIGSGTESSAPGQLFLSQGIFADRTRAQALDFKPRRKSLPSHASVEERKQMRHLLAAAELSNQHIQMQRLEHKLLADHLDKLRGQQ